MRNNWEGKCDCLNAIVSSKSICYGLQMPDALARVV